MTEKLIDGDVRRKCKMTCGKFLKTIDEIIT